MEKKLSDEQADILLHHFVNEAAADDHLIEDIANSPQVWWSVQREIRAANEIKSPWPPVEKIRRWLLIAVPVAAAAAVLVPLYIFQGSTVVVPELASNPQHEQAPSTGTNVTAPEITNPDRETPAMVAAHDQKAPGVVRTVFKSANRKNAVPRALTAAVRKEKEEIKTDFIRLTYAQTPTSGQIVRIKVPSEMMVSLGLVPSVAKPTSLIDAEVVVGDDGITHAIRFIRGQ